MLGMPLLLLLRSVMSTLPPRCSRGSVRESVVQPGKLAESSPMHATCKNPGLAGSGANERLPANHSTSQVHAIPPPGMSYTLLVPVPSPPGQCIAMRLACSPPTPLSWRRLWCYYLRHFGIELVFHLGSALTTNGEKCIGETESPFIWCTI